MKTHKFNEESKREGLNKHIQEQRKIIQEKESLIKQKNEKIQKVINHVPDPLDGRRI